MNDNGDDEAVYKSSRDFLALKNAIALQFLNFDIDITECLSKQVRKGITKRIGGHVLFPILFGKYV